MEILLVEYLAELFALVESFKHPAVSKIVGETTLLKYLAGERGEDKMEGFVEEHIKDLFVVGTSGTVVDGG